MSASANNPTATMSPPRLDAVRVAVTHSSEQAADQTELFRALGAEVFHYPCIEIIPFEQNDELDAALRDAAAGKYRLVGAQRCRHGHRLADRMKELGIDSSSLSRHEGRHHQLYDRTIHPGDARAARPTSRRRSTRRRWWQTPCGWNWASGSSCPSRATTRVGLAKCLRGTGADVNAINAYRTVIGHGGDPVPVMLWEGKIDVDHLRLSDRGPLFRQAHRARRRHACPCSTTWSLPVSVPSPRPRPGTTA